MRLFLAHCASPKPSCGKRTLLRSPFARHIRLPRMRCIASKLLRVNQCFVVWVWKCFRRSSIFRSQQFLGKRHENLGTAQVAIVFEDFILEDQVISEGVPGEVRQDPVILMPVIACNA